MIIESDERLECIYKLITSLEDDYYEAIFEDRDDDALMYFDKLLRLKKMFKNGEEFLPKF
jgi:hypothetical protein|tara:strand:- start:609 stop:788 length:180 start_codon:yes stop_codon:yes gene_type:complete